MGLADIVDNKTYNEEMAKSAYDKLGFVDKIFEPVLLIVDFGCADGAVTEMIRWFYPKATIIGYDLPSVLNDNRETLAKRTSTNLVFSADRQFITDKIEEVKRAGGKSLLVMNSVFHEIVNYENEPIRFMIELIRPFDYVWIRDMYIEQVLQGHRLDRRCFEDLSNVLESRYHERFTEYKNIMPVNNDSGAWIVEFLMKMRFKNWEKELHEKYCITSSWNDLIYAIRRENLGFCFAYSRRYILPYIKHVNESELNTAIFNHMRSTHCQLLLKKG